MQESVEQEAEKILNASIKNIELISYFKRSTCKSPIFLGTINRQYTEIQPLLQKELIIGLQPVKSYIFNIDKLENWFYHLYQERIDCLKGDIWRKKRYKNDIILLTEEMEPDPDDPEFEQKMMKVLEFARRSIEELDKMEEDKEEFNFEIGDLQEKMQADPFYNFLFYIRNDKDIIFNKRTEDNKGIIHKKILKYINKCFPGKVSQTLEFLRKKQFYKQYSPAKNYYITKIGLAVDSKLKFLSWKAEDQYEKTNEELEQEAEFNRLKEIFGF
ncbi:MAG: hypothetical protein ACTSR8_22285 [Promethearchaeota archaeon]